MAHSHHEHREHKAAKARVKHILGHKHGGAAHHGDEAADRKLFGKLIKEHEAKVHGKKHHNRFARGGVPKKDKHHTQVNIAVVAPHRGSPSPGAGAPAGMAGGPPPLPPGGPKLPMGGPSPGGPGGGPPMPPPGAGGMPPMKRGGRAYKRGGFIKMTKGAESGPGRLEKIQKYPKQKH